MDKALQDKWAIALKVANDAPKTGSVVVTSVILLAVYDEMELLRNKIDRLEGLISRLRYPDTSGI